MLHREVQLLCQYFMVILYFTFINSVCIGHTCMCCMCGVYMEVRGQSEGVSQFSPTTGL